MVFCLCPFESKSSQARSGFGPHVCVSHRQDKTHAKKAFIYLLLFCGVPWVFALCGLSLAAGRESYSWLSCVGFLMQWLLLLWSTGFQGVWLQHMGSVVMAHGLSCSMACGIFPDQGSNPYPLHWQVDSDPLCHQGSPNSLFKPKVFSYK